MYLVDALNVMLRRWYVVLAGVVFLAAGAALVIKFVPTTYQASGQMVLLLPPGASGTERPVSPWLNLQEGLTTAASLVSGAASTKDVQVAMEGQGYSADYAIAVVPGAGPIISITAKDNDPAEATATRNAMMAWVDQELQRIQDEVDVPQAQYISATRSSVSRTAEVLPGSKMRALAALGAVVGLLTLALTFGLDRLLVRRASRRQVREATGAFGDDTVAGVPTWSLDDGQDPQHDASDDVDADGLVLRFHSKRSRSGDLSGDAAQPLGSDG
jgi:capsular polysaccharide biosynthesis protein